MNETMERQLLVAELTVLVNRLRSLGGVLPDTSPKQDGTYEHLSSADLRQMLREIRDTIRTLGGGRGD